MRRTLLLNITIAWGLLALAQQDQTEYPFTEPCATMPAMEQLLDEHPSLQLNMHHGEEQVAKWIANNDWRQKAGGLEIPVVVHVMYDPAEPEQNIPDSVIWSQIDVLNEDFQRLNANAVNTRPEFDSIAANLNISFCLASQDPFGGWTDGIDRVATTADFAFTPLTNNVKRTADGGQDPWNPAHYLNIWVCDMSFFGQVLVLGYAQFPLSSQESIDMGAVAENDGIVLQYQHFGRTWDPNTFPNNKGRTASHEVGHWLGLRHIWGDGDCTQDDFVEDTPNANAQNANDCNMFQNTCDDSGNPFWNGFDPPDMVENYMDYSADDCMNMFSMGQSARIWGFLNTDSLRQELFFSQGCAPASSISEFSEHSLKVYPNPASGVFRMEWPASISAPRIRIADQLGQLVFKAIPGPYTTQYDVDLGNASAGIYFATLVSEQVSVTKKLVLE